ncbi:hypothetical protein [Marinicrinis lubricantis]|uniref:DUF4386 domain-containing protein n=1 Tax=Marinicrinis lubricantis TaxID=2086470 RepID=A0ABW1IQJ4_9BACL
MMKNEITSSFLRFASIALAVSGILFVFYPSLRPFSNATSFSGAAAFASTEWIISHVMAIVAFVLLTIGLLGLYLTVQNTMVEKLGLYSLVFTLVGTGLTLPFYGVEVFGLYVIGQETIQQHHLELMDLAQPLRFGLGFPFIVAGLIIVAGGSVLTAIAIWKSRLLPKWSGIPFAFGFLMYLPQFLGTQPIRVAHGVTIAMGCIWIAAGIWRLNRQRYLKIDSKKERIPH